MKKIYFFVLLAFAPLAIKAQSCSVFASVVNASCNGNCDGFASAVPQGVGPFAYLWQPGNMTTQTVNGLCAGTYTVVMIDSGAACTATYTFNVLQPAVLSAVAVVTQQASCQSCCDGAAVATATGGTPPYTYMWQPGNLFTPNPTGLCAGSYTLCVTDANGCVSCTGVTVNFTTGQEEIPDAPDITVLPNPAQDRITVSAASLPAGDYTISIYDLLGNEVQNRTGTNSAVLREDFDLTAYPPGLYFVRLSTANSVSVQRFLHE